MATLVGKVIPACQAMVESRETLVCQEDLAPAVHRVGMVLKVNRETQD